MSKFCNDFKPRRLIAKNSDQDLKMSGFVIHSAFTMCLLVILTGPGSALFWRPSLPTYPSDPQDPFYQAFKTVPAPEVTANKFMTNFLGYSQITKRQVDFEDIVIVMDSSGSIGSCEFTKGKEGLKHMMKTLRNPKFDSKYAAVTYSTTATVNFNFSPYSSAASKITAISYSGGSTNTQEALAEAKKLFNDPTSGRRLFATRRMVLLVTDGQSDNRDSTIRRANALKRSGIDIYVVAVGKSIHGIDEIVQVATFPPNNYLFRVRDLQEFWDVVKLIVKQVYPGKYEIVNYDPPC